MATNTKYAEAYALHHVAQEAVFSLKKRHDAEMKEALEKEQRAYDAMIEAHDTSKNWV